MNLNFFGLRHTPFGDVDSSSLFWTPKRRELAAQFHHVLTERQGMVVLTGEDGSGKTTFIRGVLDGLAPQPVKVITLSSEKLSFPLLLKALLREFSEPVPLVDALPDTATPQTPQAPAHPLAPLENIAPLIRMLHAAVLAHYSRHGGMVVLVVDQAHHLPIQTLKDFHWLSLLETPEGKLLQTIFIGNATLSLKLEMPQLHALQRRIAACGELAPLTLEESFVYLLTRLRAKLGSRPSSPVFSVEALRLLARHGKGNLRSLNTLATAALRVGATRRQKPISGQLTLEVIAELRTLPMMNRSDRSPASIVLPANFRRRPTPQSTAHPLRAASIGAIAAALFLALSYYGSRNGWPTALPNPVKFFRNDTVAQAAPGTEAAATLPVSNFVDPARFPEIEKPEQRVQAPPPQEKKHVLSRVQGQSHGNTKPLTSSRTRDGRGKKSGQPSPKGTSPLDNKDEMGTLENALPGKILYKTPPDPASNSDRLFDD
jgi:type II secretory pathway predicted ATPase ExeA